jgi:hypothetical protein
MTAAGVAPARTGSANHPGQLKISVPETVTRPWGVLEGEEGRAPDPERVAARVRQVRRRFARAPLTRILPAAGVRLTDLFPDYEIMDPLAREVMAARLAGVFEGASLGVHLSLGTAVGGGVLAVLADLRASIHAELPQGRAVGAAVRFGWQVASLYLRDICGLEVPASVMPALALDWDVAAVTEVMALVFVQAEAVLGFEAQRAGLVKSRMAVVPRQSLHELGSELGPGPQGFFTRRAAGVEELFRAAYRDLNPDYARTYNATRGWPADTEIDLLEVGTDDGEISVGGLLDEILRPDPDGPRIDPDRVLGIEPADTGGLDRTRGDVPGLPPWLAVLELRMFSPPKYDPFDRPGTQVKIDAEMADQSIARLTGVARDGDASAGLAGRLAASPEGQWVLYWLRAALAGSQQDDAIANLIAAFRAYLQRYPEDTSALQRALQPAAGHLGLPGFAQWL